MIIHGDCLEKLKELPENSVDSIVTDPPYGLSFMGKKWDYDVPSVDIWKECYRVLKPGGYLLSFAGTRTQHRMAVNIEDAGFEIRDMIAWVYGSGFPKSLNIGKQKGCEDWDGWGTALKPALEPITVARKPLSEKTVAENVLKWGTGGINIDGSRIGTEVRFNAPAGNTGDEPVPIMKSNDEYQGQEVTGRFPANLIHDGSDEVVSLFPNESQRFFYSPKASKADRDEGLEGFEDHIPTHGVGNEKGGLQVSNSNLPKKNNHPTVKPTKLMQYLVKLVTLKGGVVLDPFMGSGSTGKACKLEGFDFIGIEREEEYIEIAEARINAVQKVLL